MPLEFVDLMHQYLLLHQLHLRPVVRPAMDWHLSSGSYGSLHIQHVSEHCLMKSPLQGHVCLCNPAQHVCMAL